MRRGKGGVSTFANRYCQTESELEKIARGDERQLGTISQNNGMKPENAMSTNLQSKSMCGKFYQ